MKIVILSRAVGLDHILSSHLGKIGLSAEKIDYRKPLEPQVREADILINGLGKIDRSLIDSCPKLRLVHQIGTGIDSVDVDYCTNKAVYVAHVPKANSVAVAEHALFLMTYLAKNIKAAGRGIMQRRVLNVLGTELQGKTLLIIGLGYIGSEVARRANAFGMEVIAVTRRPIEKIGRIHGASSTSEYQRADSQAILKDSPASKLEIHNPSELNNCLPRADYISLHTSLTLETQDMIAEKEFSLMRNNAYLINVARAQIVNRAALFNALFKHQIAGAAFDVFWEEPADPTDPLFGLENFVLTPHIAGWTAESAKLAAEIITKNIDRLAHGLFPLTSVNSF